VGLQVPIPSSGGDTNIVQDGSLAISRNFLRSRARRYILLPSVSVPTRIHLILNPTNYAPSIGMEDREAVIRCISQLMISHSSC